MNTKELTETLRTHLASLSNPPGQYTVTGGPTYRVLDKHGIPITHLHRFELAALAEAIAFIEFTNKHPIARHWLRIIP